MTTATPPGRTYSTGPVERLGSAAVSRSTGVTEAQVFAMVDSGRAELERAWAAGDPTQLAQVVNRAEAIRYLSKKAGLALEASNAAARLKVDAERRAGQLLREREAHPPGPVPVDRSHDATHLPPRLKDLGIGKDQSSRWQDMARVPEETVAAFLQQQETRQAEIT